MKFIKWLKKNAGLLIISLILVSGSLMYYSYSGITSENFYFLMFLYLGVFIFAGTFPQNRILNIVKTIIYIPFFLLMLIKPFAGFFFALIVGLYVPLAIISLMFIHLPENLFQIDLLSSTKVYLILTIWTIVISTYGEYFMKQAILIQEYDKSEEKQTVQIDFNKSLINNRVVKYLLFFTYFVILIVFSIIELNHYDVFGNDDLYLAINLSFVSFLAFDRLIVNKNLINLTTKKVKSNLLKVWKIDLSDLTGENRKTLDNVNKDEAEKCLIPKR